MLASKVSPKKQHKYLFDSIKFILIIVIVVGIFLRFTNLELKVFWVDEVINTHYSLGYQEIDIGDQVKAWNGEPITVQELQKYQSLNSDKNAIDVIKALAIEEPQSPPIYYILLRWWMELFGDSVTVRRSLSACLSLFAFPSIYWLCWELFRFPLTGVIAMSLLAVSPFHLIYAQEVRYYSAWTVLILFSSAVFLWAIRQSKKSAWGLYAIAISAGFYTFPFTGLVAISHGIYLIILNKFKITKSFINYLLALSISVINFLPWIIFLVNNSHKMSKWRQVDSSLFSLIKHWIAGIEIVFWDFHKISLGEFRHIKPLFLDYSLKIFLLALIGYAIYYLYRYSKKRSWLFLLTLIIFPWLALSLPDLVVGGIRSTISRYLIPSYLGIQITVAYLFGSQLNSKSSTIQDKNFWRILMSVMLSISIISCGVISQAEVWWNKSNNVDNPAIAEIINETENPLLVGVLNDNDGRSIISLSYLLDPKVKLQLIHNPLDPPNIPNNFSDIFLYNTSDEIKNKIDQEQNLKPELFYQGKRRSLWKISSHDLSMNNSKIPSFNSKLI